MTDCRLAVQKLPCQTPTTESTATPAITIHQLQSRIPFSFTVFSSREFVPDKNRITTSAITGYTRKPCYRKDDRAMRPIYWCPEKFRESSQTPPTTFPEICKRLLFRSILRMCIQNLKFGALSVPEIIGVLKKFG